MRLMQKLIGCFIFLFCFLADTTYSCMPQLTKYNLNEVIWNEDQFVCVGDSGTVLKSIDGHTWDRVSFPATDDLKSIETVGTMLMIRSSRKGTYFLTDHSLQNFETITNTAYPADCFTYFKGSIFFIDTVRYAPMRLLPTLSGFSLRTSNSPLQRYWNPSIEEPLYLVNSLTSSPDRIVVSGNHTSMQPDSTMTNNPFLLSSADGITWDTIREHSLWRMEQVLWTGDQFIACGMNGLLVSNDGIKWQSSFFRTSFADNRCTWGYGTIIMTWNSTDYTSIAATRTVPPDTLYRQLTLQGNEVFTANGTAISPSAAVVVGSKGTIWRYLVATTRWERCVTPIISTMNSVCWNGNMFVTVGNSGFIAVSPDGAEWKFNARIVKDTVLSTFPDTYTCLQGVVTIAAPCTSGTTVTVEPGTILKIAPGAHMVFNYLIGKGTKEHPIQFTARDPAQPWKGISIVDGQLDYCFISGGVSGTFDYGGAGGLLYVKKKVFLAHSFISAVSGQKATLFVDDGLLEVQALRVKGTASIGTSTGAAYVFHNSLFEDSTSCFVSSIQNNFASRGTFVNCTFGRGCTMSTSNTTATEAVRLYSVNCAFEDATGTMARTQKYVGYERCASGDSLFVNAAAKNFHLLAGSVAIDSGLNEKVQYTEDLDGNPRIYGKMVDIGAFEFNPDVGQIAISNMAEPRHSIEISNRMLKLQYPAAGSHACEITIFSCAGRLLWNCHLPQSRFQSGSAAVSLPRLSPGIIVIRVRSNASVECVKTLIPN